MAERRPLVAGNWKMNGTLAETRSLLLALINGAGAVVDEVDLLVIPPFTALAEAKELIDSALKHIDLGGQDLHWEEKGAFTGEVSGAMLRDAGCTHVLVGHSERRTLFGEAGELLLKKLTAALHHSLVPILCVGEDLEQRESGSTDQVLDAQLTETILRLPTGEVRETILAYEPVWAIGTGRTATPEQAQEAHRHIREQVAAVHGTEIADRIRILYGGSVNPGNAAGLLQRPGIDGALVGGSSLRAADFLEIARAAIPLPEA